jgi:hypothetical protein
MDCLAINSPWRLAGAHDGPSAEELHLRRASFASGRQQACNSRDQEKAPPPNLEIWRSQSWFHGSRRSLRNVHLDDCKTTTTCFDDRKTLFCDHQMR